MTTPLELMGELEEHPEIPIIDSDEWRSLRAAIEARERWINDLQSGMYINCVYCGHRYGPESETPASMADVLKEHIEECPEHPMSRLKAELAQKDARIKELEEKVNE